MAGEKKKNVLKGCIKEVKGPWLVHRKTKEGKTITRLRHPSERERQNNKRREKERRSVTRNIFTGIRAQGNYHLPKHADRIDILKVLCKAAGWNVDEDGHVSRKNLVSQMPGLINNTQACQVRLDRQDEDYCKCNEAYEICLNRQYEDGDYCNCTDNRSSRTMAGNRSRTSSQMLMHHHDGSDKSFYISSANFVVDSESSL